MSEFKLSLDRLSESPQHFEYEAPQGWWLGREGERTRTGEGSLEDPLRFEGTASRVGSTVVIEGAFEGGLSAECSRCTRRYAHALREAFRLVLEPWSEDARGDARRAAVDPEGERAVVRSGLCLGDDLEAGWYRGPVVFLDDFFAEIVALAIPIQPLCEEDCPGLCPHCGMERRRGSIADAPTAMCRCADEKVESPFAVLASLRVRKDESAPEAGGQGGEKRRTRRN